MNLRPPFKRLVLSAAIAGLVAGHPPALRADTDPAPNVLAVDVAEGSSGFSFDDLEDLYEWLKELFEGQESEEDSEEEDSEEDDEDGDEFEDDELDDDEVEEDDIDEADEDFEDEDFEEDDEFEDADDFEDDEESEFDDDDLDGDEEGDEAEDSEDGEDDEDEDSEDDENDDGDDESTEHCEFDDFEEGGVDDESEEGEFDEDEEDLGDDEPEDDGGDDEGEDAYDECDPFAGFNEGAGFGFVNTNPVANETIHPVSVTAANDASRFLAHATMGANYPLITQVANQGHEVWLEEQFNQPIGLTRPYVDYLVNRLEHADETMGEVAAERLFEAQGIPEDYFGYAWWTQGITSPDLVRQRVATALTEIFVIGRTVEEIGESPVALATFYDMLLNNAFGNFKDLLLDVTMNPAMGIYLSHYENAKADPDKGTFPDENYAREVMQLFSIGLFELNSDGTRKLDSNGQPIATYNNDDIREFAKVFTGLGNGGEDESFAAEDGESYVDQSQPMAMYEAYHDKTAKKLLNGTVLPAGQSGLQDIQGAIDNLFNHPNVGPFIGRLLIQRLVTSNPSPEYVARVTAAFSGDGNTPRGDMKAVIRAILLDREALNPPELAMDSQGKLREPMLRAMHLMRAFNINAHDRTFNGTAYTLREQTNQWIFASPSVFNFFQPDYAPLGEISQQGLVAPEFQITSASTIIGIKNYLAFVLGEDGPLEEEALESSIAQLDLTRELALSDEALLNRLDTKLTYGSLTPTTRAAVLDSISNLEGEQKVRTAIFLIMISPDYATTI